MGQKRRNNRKAGRTQWCKRHKAQIKQDDKEAKGHQNLQEKTRLQNNNEVQGEMGMKSLFECQAIFIKWSKPNQSRI